MSLELRTQARGSGAVGGAVPAFRIRRWAAHKILRPLLAQQPDERRKGNAVALVMQKPLKIEDRELPAMSPEQARSSDKHLVIPRALHRRAVILVAQDPSAGPRRPAAPTTAGGLFSFTRHRIRS